MRRPLLGIRKHKQDWKKRKWENQVKKNTEDFIASCGLLMTKINYEFTDLTTVKLHPSYMRWLKKYQKTPLNPRTTQENGRHVLYVAVEEKRVLASWEKLPGFVNKAIHTALERQFDGVKTASINRTEYKDDRNWSLVRGYAVSFSSVEYKGRNTFMLDSSKTDKWFVALEQIISYVQQMDSHHQHQFVLTFRDTLNTLNNTLTRAAAHKNEKVITTMILNIREVSLEHLRDMAKEQSSYAKTEIEADTILDDILQMELNFTELVAKKNKSIEALKKYIS